MFNIEKAFWELLQNNIQYKDQNVPLVRTIYQNDKTPCITLSLANESMIKREYTEYELIQYYHKVFSAEMWIHIWCNNEPERSGIIESLEKRLTEAEINHYTTCANYNPKNSECSVLGRECEALTVKNGRGLKKQCPHPEQNNYTSFFRKNKIKKNSFVFDSKISSDELDCNPPLLHSILKIRFNYHKYVHIGGCGFEDMELDTVVKN